MQPSSGGLYLEPRPIGQVKITKILSANGTDITNAFDSNQLEELEDEIAGDIDED